MKDIMSEIPKIKNSLVEKLLPYFKGESKQDSTSDMFKPVEHIDRSSIIPPMMITQEIIPYRPYELKLVDPGTMLPPTIHHWLRDWYYLNERIAYQPYHLQIPFITGRSISLNEYITRQILGHIKKTLTLAFVLTGTPFLDYRFRKKQLPAVIHAYGFFRIGEDTFIILPQMVQFRTTFDLREGHPYFVHFMLMIADIALFDIYQHHISNPMIRAGYNPPYSETQEKMRENTVHHTVLVPVSRLYHPPLRQPKDTELDPFIVAASHQQLSDIKNSLKYRLKDLGINPLKY